jgi:type VI protein secretion system component Hcp
VLTLQGVTIQSIQQSGSGGSAPTESLSLGYRTVSWSFTDAAGNSSSGGWDIAENAGL